VRWKISQKRLPEKKDGDDSQHQLRLFISNVTSCDGFWTPATMKDPHAQLAGVQKPPRHEVAGSWAPAKQRAL
jgi:hypothetical protein